MLSQKSYGLNEICADWEGWRKGEGGEGCQPWPAKVASSLERSEITSDSQSVVIRKPLDTSPGVNPKFVI